MKYTKYFRSEWYVLYYIKALFEECNHQTRNRNQFERYFEDHKT